MFEWNNVSISGTCMCNQEYVATFGHSTVNKCKILYWNVAAETDLVTSDDYNNQ